MMKLKSTQTGQYFEKNYPNMILSLESRSCNNSSLADTRTIKYTKIKFFEYGYNFVDPFELKSKFFLGFSELKYNIEENSISVIIHDKENFPKKMAINGRGKNKVIFGYNKSGDYFKIKGHNNLPLEVNQINKVFLTVTDEDSGIEYFLGREDNNLKGYKNENKKTPFFMFIISK